MNNKSNNEIKLNIGCGPCGLNNWLNYDYGILPLLSKVEFLRNILIFLKILPETYNRKWPDIKLVDIKKRFPLPDNSVKYIFCSQVVEHLERWEALKTLRECHRVLKDTGVMRISLPDIRKMIDIYNRNSKNKNDRAARDLCRLWYGVDKDVEPSFIGKISKNFIRDHAWHYDFDELWLLTKEAGFSRIKICNYQKGTLPDLEQLEIQEHKQHSLYVEITR